MSSTKEPAAPAVELSGKQRRALRAQGHHLDPVVQVGKEGLSVALLGAVDEALLSHELIKVRISENAPGERHEIAAALAEAIEATLVQVLGRTLLLYRPRPEEDESEEEDGDKAGAEARA